MSTNIVDDMLSVVRRPAFARLHELMDRVPPGDMSTSEILALIAVLESADQRVNAPSAPVLHLIPT